MKFYGILTGEVRTPRFAGFAFVIVQELQPISLLNHSIIKTS
jgi:hypothetical protein